MAVILARIGTRKSQAESFGQTTNRDTQRILVRFSALIISKFGNIPAL